MRSNDQTFIWPQPPPESTTPPSTIMMLESESSIIGAPGPTTRGVETSCPNIEACFLQAASLAVTLPTRHFSTQRKEGGSKPSRATPYSRKHCSGRTSECILATMFPLILRASDAACLARTISAIVSNSPPFFSSTLFFLRACTAMQPERFWPHSRGAPFLHPTLLRALGQKPRRWELFLAEFGREQCPHPGATKQPRQSCPQRVQHSSQRNSFRRKASESSKVQRLSISASEIHSSRRLSPLSHRCLAAAWEAVTRARLHLGAPWFRSFYLLECTKPFSDFSIPSVPCSSQLSIPFCNMASGIGKVESTQKRLIMNGDSRLSLETTFIRRNGCKHIYFLRACSAFDLTVRVAQFPHLTPPSLWALGTTATETILLWEADFG